MRKFIVTLMASLLSCSAAFAFWPEATDSSLEVGVGYRRDRLEWKTSTHFDSSYSSDSYLDDYGLPLKLSSELKWRHLDIWEIEARGKYVTCDNVYLRANGDYGWITSGKNTDSDFVDFKDDYSYSYRSRKSFEFAHSKSRARGNVYDARVAVGYQFKLCDDSFAIAPLVGYSWHGQHIRDRHLKQNFYFDDTVIEEESVVVRSKSKSGSDFSSGSESGSGSDSDYSSASFSEYSGSGSGSGSSYDSYGKRHGHSKYHSRWNGPFIGFDFDYRFGCGCEADWELFGTYEFHWATYHAKARWHMRSDLFDGFHHRAKNAYGHIFDIGIKYDFCECWTLAVKGEFQWWWADHGRDRAKIAGASVGDVKTDCFLSIPLHHIRWQSAAVIVDLGMIF